MRTPSPSLDHSPVSRPLHARLLEAKLSSLNAGDGKEFGKPELPERFQQLFAAIPGLADHVAVRGTRKEDTLAGLQSASTKPTVIIPSSAASASAPSTSQGVAGSAPAITVSTPATSAPVPLAVSSAVMTTTTITAATKPETSASQGKFYHFLL